MTGVKATHIPYKGTGPATTALLGKEYHFNFMGLSAATQLSPSGRLRGLAVTSTQRLKSNPGHSDRRRIRHSRLRSRGLVRHDGAGQAAEAVAQQDSRRVHEDAERSGDAEGHLQPGRDGGRQLARGVPEVPARGHGEVEKGGRRRAAPNRSRDILSSRPGGPTGRPRLVSSFCRTPRGELVFAHS